MSLLVCQFFQRLQRYPKAILLLALLATAFSFAELRNLRVNVSLSALFETEGESRVEATTATMLAVVFSGPDGESNHRAMVELEERVNGLPGVRLALHRTDSAFLARNWPFYVDLPELERVRDEIRRAVDRLPARSNPFVVPLSGEDSAAVPWDLERLRRAALPEFLDFFGTPDGTVSALFVLPQAGMGDPRAARALLDGVDSLARALLPAGSEVRYTGEVEQLAEMDSLMRRLPLSLLLAFAVVLVLVLLYFSRQPLAPLLALIPGLMGFAWTLALSNRILHAITPPALMLMAVFFAVSIALTVHMLARYQEERLKGMGHALSMETLLLETGPALALSCLVWAICCFSLCSLGLKGYRDFGLMSGLSVLMQMTAVLLVFPALLQLVQRRFVLRVRGPVRRNLRYFQQAPLRDARWMAVAVALILFASFASGLPFSFDKRLEMLGLVRADDDATALLRRANIALKSPVLVTARDEASCDSVARALNAWIRSSGLVHRFMVRSEQIVPADQEEKLELFDEVRDILDSQALASMPASARDPAKRFLERLPDRPAELPANMRRLLELKDLHAIALVPVFDRGDGRMAARMVRSLDPMAERMGFRLTGAPVVLGRLVERTLPDLPRIWLRTFLLVLLLLWIEVGLRRALFEILLPVAVGAIPLMAWIFATKTGLNPTNAPLMPLVMGLVFNSVIAVQHRHMEEGDGSLPFVLKTTGAQNAFSTAVAVVIFSPLLFSGVALTESVGATLAGGAVAALFASEIAAPLALAVGERLAARSRAE